MSFIAHFLRLYLIFAIIIMCQSQLVLAASTQVLDDEHKHVFQDSPAVSVSSALPVPRSVTKQIIAPFPLTPENCLAYVANSFLNYTTDFREFHSVALSSRINLIKVCACLILWVDKESKTDSSNSQDKWSFFSRVIHPGSSYSSNRELTLTPDSFLYLSLIDGSRHIKYQNESLKNGRGLTLRLLGSAAWPDLSGVGEEESKLLSLERHKSTLGNFVSFKEAHKRRIRIVEQIIKEKHFDFKTHRLIDFWKTLLAHLYMAKSDPAEFKPQIRYDVIYSGNASFDFLDPETITAIESIEDPIYFVYSAATVIYFPFYINNIRSETNVDSMKIYLEGVWRLLRKAETLKISINMFAAYAPAFYTYNKRLSLRKLQIDLTMILNDRENYITLHPDRFCAD